MTPQNFGSKLAFVQLSPATRTASKPKDPFQHPPAIGQSKLPPPVPPATADAKMVMRAAPSVPNPIVPPAQSGKPFPTNKIASAIRLGAIQKAARLQKLVSAVKLATDVKLAPRYTAKGGKGRKAMPEPHARQNKPAPITPAGFGRKMAMMAGAPPAAPAQPPMPGGAPPQGQMHPMMAQILAGMGGGQPPQPPAGGLPPPQPGMATEQPVIPGMLTGQPSQPGMTGGTPPGGAGMGSPGAGGGIGDMTASQMAAP